MTKNIHLDRSLMNFIILASYLICFHLKKNDLTGMNFNKKIIPFIWMIFHGFLSHGQKVDSNLVSITWTNLAKGIDYCETDAPIKSIVNDSKLSILKIQPQQVEFLLLSASEFDNKPRTASGWADSFDV